MMMKFWYMILKVDSFSVVVFDLDDTLYDEIDFLKSGFQFIAGKYCKNNAQQAYSDLIEWYSARLDAFDKLIERYKLFNQGVTKEDLLSDYRFHQPVIKLRDKASEFIFELKNLGVKLALITDGRSITQRNKINALGLSRIFDEIIISEEVKSEKPSELNFKLVMSSLPAKRYYYIGDNLAKDFIAPNDLGWTTICYKDQGCNIHSQAKDGDDKYLPEYYIHGFSDFKIEFVE